MTKLGVMAVVAVTGLLAGCGGSTKTVTIPPSTTSSTSHSAGPTPLKPSAVAACLKAGGAKVKGILPAGPGTEVYAVTQDGAVVGAIQAPNAPVTRQIEHTFSAGGYKIRRLKDNSTAFALYKGKLTSVDSALLSKCTR